MMNFGLLLLLLCRSPWEGGVCRPAIASADCCQHSDSTVVAADSAACFGKRDTALFRPDWLSWRKPEPYPAIDFSLKKQPKQLFYFSIYDVTDEYRLTRMSRYSSPLHEDWNDFRYLWSGSATRLMERGFPAGSFNAPRKGYQIYFIRREGKVVGIGIPNLEP